MGWADETTPTLKAIRANLLRGLDRIAVHAAAGTLHTPPAGKATPPIEAGQLTRILLEGLDQELTRRGDAP
jgi:hypothetical protein